MEERLAKRNLEVRDMHVLYPPNTLSQLETQLQEIRCPAYTYYANVPTPGPADQTVMDRSMFIYSRPPRLYWPPPPPSYYSNGAKDPFGA